MSFIIDNFSPVGGQARAGNSPAHWSYGSSTDDLATVLGSNYFDEVGTQVSPGDFISVFLTDGKAILSVSSTTVSPPGVVIDSLVIIPDGGSRAFPVDNFTGITKNLVVGDDLKFFVMNNAASQTVNIPDNAAEAFPIGAEMDFLREGVGTVTFFAPGAAVLQSRNGLDMINTQYSAATLKKIDTDEWRLFGEIA